MSPSKLAEQLLQNALNLGADYFGIADLSPGTDLVMEQGGEMIAQFPRALSVGVAMPSAIVDQLPRHQDYAVALAYRSHSYTILNNRLDHITSRLAGIVQGRGHRVFPVRASQTVNSDRLYGLISHKLAAHLAGHGWIGRSCLLVTPDRGPRVRWATVLTDAPLPAGSSMDVRCGDCRECVDACPAQAFTGRLFSEDEPREARFDVFKCLRYLSRHHDIPGVDDSVCGMCVYSCPHGK